MGKKTSKKCARAIMVTILLATVGAVTVGAHTTNIEGNQTFKYNELSGDILSTVIKLKEQGTNQKEIQAEIQSILQESRVLGDGQSSMSLKEFYGASIFSCRGFV